jgi:hypothetical protein
MGGYTLPYQDAVNYERTDRSKLMIMLPCMQTTVKWVFYGFWLDAENGWPVRLLLFRNWFHRSIIYLSTIII